MGMAKICLVCRKVSNGMHFGAMTCRACAAFFRRAVVLNLQYKCKKGDESCNIDGRGRFICRHCRLLRCQEIGMNAEKVQLDYDPTYSIRGLCDDNASDGCSSPQGSIGGTDEEKPCSSKKNLEVYKPMHPDLLFKFKPKPNDKSMMTIDFTDLSNNIELNFNVKMELECSELTKLTKALHDFRYEQKPKEKLSLIGTIEISSYVKWLNSMIFQLSKWFSQSSLLMSLPKDQKMQLFRSSWDILRIFERIEISTKLFDKELFTKNKHIFDDGNVWMCDHSMIDFSTITELTNQYFNKLFQPYLCRYIEDVGKPLFELNLMPEEVVFCMVQLIGCDHTDLTEETIEVIANLKEEIADEMHHFYMNNTEITVYSHRILKMMSIVNTTKKIAHEKGKIKELFWIFDIFHADISEPYFFEVF